jgi:hypothetical protein
MMAAEPRLRAEELWLSQAGGRTYKSRIAPFLASLAIHASFCCFVFLVQPTQTPDDSKDGIPKRLLDNGKTYKLVWYRFNKNLPDISAQKAGAGVKTRTVLNIPTTIQIDSAKAQSEKQVVWQPAPKIKLEADLKSPNVVVTQGAFSPPSSKPEPRRFVPPPERRAALRAPGELPMPPRIAESVATATTPLATPMLAPKPKPKAFVAPDRLSVPATATPSEQPILPPPPSISESPKLTIATAVTATLPEAPRPQPKQFVPPTVARSTSERPTAAMDAPPAVSGTGGAPALPEVLAAVGGNGITAGNPPMAGTGEMTLAIIGVSPDASQPQLPDGSRSAKLSTGGAQGAGGAGETQAAALIIPNVMVRGRGDDKEQRDSLRPAPPASRGGLDPARGASNSQRVSTQTLLSAALRPNARRVPAMVEARFSGRVLYSSVLDTTQGQWQIWFAELHRQNSNAPAIWAPIPVTRILDADWISNIPRVPGQRVQITAIIRKDGSVDSIRGLQGVTVGSAQMIAEAMSLLRFTPAMRFGVAVDVEMILDIPVSSPNLVRKAIP